MDHKNKLLEWMGFKMKKPEYQNYRVCYDNGNAETGIKSYQLYKYCLCKDCQRRQSWNRTPANCIIASTQDISKVDEIAKFLKNWTCDNGNEMLEKLFVKF